MKSVGETDIENGVQILLGYQTLSSERKSCKTDCANEFGTVQNITYREENPKSHEKQLKSHTESKISRKSNCWVKGDDVGQSGLSTSPGSTTRSARTYGWLVPTRRRFDQCVAARPTASGVGVGDVWLVSSSSFRSSRCRRRWRRQLPPTSHKRHRRL